MAPLAPESVSPRDVLSRLAESASASAAHINPTRTLSEVASKALHPRQAATTTVVSDIDSGSNQTTLSGGQIAGIVIGSIAGFLLLLWIIRSCTNLGRSPTTWGDTFEPEHEKPVTHRRHHHSSTPYYHQETHRSRSRHSHGHGGHSHSPRRSVEVRPVYYEGGRSRGRSPRAPPAAYTNGGLDGRDLRRSSGGSRNYRY
ncbi:hypothetical protein UCREL1_1451 [Eutypa lata UCREL1]|uniref:Uncharacterized protein n=1 Tax=Eutypa lata (strain UCR-EL1) TaxID=1287681 RepID=M7T4H2_EUTLA|nr:hypothetical protein UCREL1_1451 [Eutypa lata UCREL1]